jgi:hypothetical protein
MDWADTVRKLKAQQMEVLDKLHTARVDLRTLSDLPKSPARDREVATKREQVAALEKESGRLEQLRSTFCR